MVLYKYNKIIIPTILILIEKLINFNVSNIIYLNDFIACC